MVYVAAAEAEAEPGVALPLPPVIADLRSDTVTLPTARMRKAMAEAVCGDDVMEDDPTVAALEARVAALLGKEAGLFVPSGTMGNLLAVMCWCPERGDEFIVGSEAHIVLWEQGGSAFLGGCFPRILPNKPDGTLDLASIEALAARGEDIHCQRLKLVCLEQTHNMLGGLPLPLEFTDAVGALASRRGLAVHVDGARLLNAAAALGAPPARLVAAASSACLCLSKGLGAPVGSVLVGPSGFVAKARRLRKALGGGMRQAGVLAAAGLVALDEVAPLLAADHGRCGALASRLAALPGVSLRDGPPPTNIVFLRLHPALDAAALAAGLRAAGVLASVAPGACRLVLHHQVTDAGVERVVAAFAGLVGPMMEAAAAAAAEAPGEGGA